MTVDKRGNMLRNFDAIKTLEDARDALVGAKVIEVGDKKIILETLVGERFSLTMVAEPIPIKVGNMSFSASSDKINLKFAKEE